MSLSRPVPWVSAVLYGAVLAAGLYAWSRGLGATSLPLFAGGLAALLALDLAEWRRHPEGAPRATAAALLAARVALYVVVATADGSGLARALFVLVPFTAYFAFGRAAAVALAVATLGLVFAGYELGAPRWYADIERVSDLLMFAIGLVLTMAMAAVAVEERRARARLRESGERLAEYAGRVAELSAAAERNRVARDIHDDLGHDLTAIAVLLEKATAFRGRDPGTADAAVAEAHRAARRALEGVRRSVRMLRAGAEAERVPEDRFELAAALRDLVSRQVDDGRLTVTLDFSGDEHGYPAPALAALYRAAQEGITNSRRHAAATKVVVSAHLGDDAARLVVADDGRGFPPGSEGFGLLGMRERVRLAGGRVEITSGSGEGTRLTVTIPRGAK
ncbi:signal transduction histidine kinase [Thermocatellispora tengchongensis]|uniref:Oxygen sensor histidine kinase NreB n=1 Tax=Thermocatellispora tengchongensis TaxID=1073253 RepID=A0A840PQK9_9ACTN|nr:sensor histidine kinase [Thermocatellispora tengchongensis]MBB5140373.1 signal transduction histidine kinase [Thermocatellispora tengchongensis]